MDRDFTGAIQSVPVDGGDQRGVWSAIGNSGWNHMLPGKNHRRNVKGFRLKG